LTPASSRLAPRAGAGSTQLPRLLAEHLPLRSMSSPTWSVRSQNLCTAWRPGAAAACRFRKRVDVASGCSERRGCGAPTCARG
jgi:hypothetical protein